MDLPREIEDYRNLIFGDPPKVPPKIIYYWLNRIVPANLYSLGEQGAYKYITRYGGKFSEKTLVHYAIQAETESQPNMARGFWKRAYEAKKKKDNSTMKPQSLKVFLCHAHSDAIAVHDIYHRLVKIGADAWLDKAKLLPGSDWEYEIRKAVREADVVVVCLSRNFNQRGFRQKEVRLALDVAMEQPDGEIFIIPARLEECESLESLKKWHWVDLYETDGYEKLVHALRTRAQKVGASLK